VFFLRKAIVLNRIYVQKSSTCVILGSEESNKIYYIVSVLGESQIYQFLLSCVLPSVNKLVMLCYVMLCYVMLCYVMLCHVMSCHVMSCYVMLCYVMLCYVMLCYVMLYVISFMLYIIIYVMLYKVIVRDPVHKINSEYVYMNNIYMVD
jgi:hypothetical protein